MMSHISDCTNKKNLSKLKYGGIWWDHVSRNRAESLQSSGRTGGQTTTGRPSCVGGDIRVLQTDVNVQWRRDEEFEVTVHTHECEKEALQHKLMSDDRWAQGRGDSDSSREWDDVWWERSDSRPTKDHWGRERCDIATTAHIQGMSPVAESEARVLSCHTDGRLWGDSGR